MEQKLKTKRDGYATKRGSTAAAEPSDPNGEQEAEGEVPETSDIWFLRYEEQRKANTATQDRIMGLEKEVAKMRESSAAHHAGPVESMSEKDMKLLLKKMERQVLALKGELKDYEWRLDQESAAHHKALEEKRDLALQLSRMNGARDNNKQTWEPMHKRRSMPKVANHVGKP